MTKEQDVMKELQEFQKKTQEELARLNKENEGLKAKLNSKDAINIVEEVTKEVNKRLTRTITDGIGIAQLPLGDEAIGSDLIIKQNQAGQPLTQTITLDTLVKYIEVREREASKIFIHNELLAGILVTPWMWNSQPVPNGFTMLDGSSYVGANGSGEFFSVANFPYTYKNLSGSSLSIEDIIASLGDQEIPKPEVREGDYIRNTQLLGGVMYQGSYKTARPSNNFTFSTNTGASGAHSHERAGTSKRLRPIFMPGSGSESVTGFTTKTDSKYSVFVTESAPNHTHTVSGSIEGGGDGATEPNNTRGSYIMAIDRK